MPIGAFSKITDYFPGISASPDLSSKQFYMVYLASATQVTLPDGSASEVPIGVLQNEPSSGYAATVECGGISKVVAGETIAAGDLVGTDNAGKAKKVEASNTGADIGDWAIGICIEGGDAGELIAVKLGISHRVEAA